MKYRKQIQCEILRKNLEIITDYLLRELPEVGSKDFHLKDCFLCAFLQAGGRLKIPTDVLNFL
jgi:hypothetical protein